MIVIKEGKHENGLSIIGKIKDASKVATYRLHHGGH